ncbi:abdominal ganglion neuropeptides L5-67-like [Littorina saxatilis]|uniref:Uncharacterized protein n=1 Tax=Littorina saxatilis TaxID=31220 RepID=A0AAN9ASV9_9CAEN
MQKIAVAMLVVCMLVLTSLLEQTTAAPQWRPQGRFGKRGDFGITTRMWKPQGRFGKRAPSSDDVEESLKTSASSGEIEVPVEAMASSDRAAALNVVVKFCTLADAPGFSPCSSWAPESP